MYHFWGRTCPPFYKAIEICIVFGTIRKKTRVKIKHNAEM